jgi:hypothetical protein
VFAIQSSDRCGIWKPLRVSCLQHLVVGLSLCWWCLKGPCSRRTLILGWCLCDLMHFFSASVRLVAVLVIWAHHSCIFLWLFLWTCAWAVLFFLGLLIGSQDWDLLQFVAGNAPVVRKYFLQGGNMWLWTENFFHSRQNPALRLDYKLRWNNKNKNKRDQWVDYIWYSWMGASTVVAVAGATWPTVMSYCQRWCLCLLWGLLMCFSCGLLGFLLIWLGAMGFVGKCLFLLFLDLWSLSDTIEGSSQPLGWTKPQYAVTAFDHELLGYSIVQKLLLGWSSSGRNCILSHNCQSPGWSPAMEKLAQPWFAFDIIAGNQWGFYSASAVFSLSTQAISNCSVFDWTAIWLDPGNFQGSFAAAWPLVFDICCLSLFHDALFLFCCWYVWPLLQIEYGIVSKCYLY